MLLRRLSYWLSSVCIGLMVLFPLGAQGQPPRTTLVSSLVFEDVADNSWSNLEFPDTEQPPGLYYIELSELDGTVGCWGSKKNPYENGPNGELLMAWKDDEPWDNNEDSDFRLQYLPTKGIWTELIVVAPQGAINDLWFPFGLVEAEETIGQTFIAPEGFTGVGLQTPTWNTNNSQCTISLYSAAGESQAIEPNGKLAVEWGRVKATTD